jgi:hypothetical protein
MFGPGVGDGMDQHGQNLPADDDDGVDDDDDDDDDDEEENGDYDDSGVGDYGDDDRNGVTKKSRKLICVVLHNVCSSPNFSNYIKKRPMDAE